MAELPPSVKALLVLAEQSSQQFCERFSVQVLAARIGHIENDMAPRLIVAFRIRAIAIVPVRLCFSLRSQTAEVQPASVHDRRPLLTPNSERFLN